EDHNFYQTIYKDFYEDRFINVLWRANSRNLLCYLMNKTDSPIKILWNKSYFITDDLTDFISHSDVSQVNVKKDQIFSVVPVGKRWAVFQYKSFVFGGFLGSIMRSLADFVSYSDIAGTQKAIGLWAHTSDLEEQCVLCKTALSDKQGLLAGLTESY
ncbi:MAG TPA: hypothetical protein PLJ04_02735, partial [Candidatus Saccharibacteria bacterium]|nr:hypothetical protein [Candidatus Saccharibacteria bacterium]